MIGDVEFRLQDELRRELERCVREDLWQEGRIRGLKTWRGRGKHRGYYRSPADFLLRHGRQFESPEHCWGFPLAIPGFCFANSVLAMRHVEPPLRYVEGVVWAPPASVAATGEPVGAHRLVHHAWNLNRADRVVDTTYLNTPAAAKQVAYFGVIFDDPTLVVRSAWEDDHTVLDNPTDEWALLREPWTPRGATDARCPHPDDRRQEGVRNVRR